jgi:TRAP-type C4-dicarboxylate transport system permease small subunit
MFKRSRFYFLISSICIVLFVINLIVGKIEVAYRIDTIVHLEGVPEFILLLVSIIFFVISTLLKEQSATNKTQQNLKGG